MLYHFLDFLYLLQNRTKHPVSAEISTIHVYPAHWTFLQVLDAILAAAMLFHAYHHGYFSLEIKLLITDKTTGISEELGEFS